jgi:hypothetical protein
MWDSWTFEADWIGGFEVCERAFDNLRKGNDPRRRNLDDFFLKIPEVAHHSLQRDASMKAAHHA